MSYRVICYEWFISFHQLVTQLIIFSEKLQWKKERHWCANRRETFLKLSTACPLSVTPIWSMPLRNRREFSRSVQSPKTSPPVKRDRYVTHLQTNLVEWGMLRTTKGGQEITYKDIQNCKFHKQGWFYFICQIGICHWFNTDLK